jgi:hypothetical protein
MEKKGSKPPTRLSPSTLLKLLRNQLSSLPGTKYEWIEVSSHAKTSGEGVNNDFHDFNG